MKRIFILLIALIALSCGVPDEVLPPLPQDQEEIVICGFHPEQNERCCDKDEQCPNGEVQFKDCSKHQCNLETRFCEWIEIPGTQDQDCEFSGIEGICNQGVCNPK